MSYVRWSSDDFKSDFYIYEDVRGGYTLHLAGRRHVNHEPNPHDMLTETEKWCAFENARPESVTVPIDHPEAGETYNTSTLEEMVETCERLIAEGFCAPEWLIEHLKEEAAEDARAP